MKISLILYVTYVNITLPDNRANDSNYFHYFKLPYQNSLKYKSDQITQNSRNDQNAKIDPIPKLAKNDRNAKINRNT